MDHPTVYVSEIAELFPPQGMWTEADYLRLPHTRRVVELSGGRLTVHSPCTPDHQRVAGDLAIALDKHVADHKLGEVLFASVVVRLWMNQLRMPDVIFLRAQHIDRKRKMWIDGPPDWVAEITSPNTRHLDEEKLADYARAAIPETWLVDPQDRSIRVYVLDQELPDYALVATYVPGEMARAETIPGFILPVDDLF